MPALAQVELERRIAMAKSPLSRNEQAKALGLTRKHYDMWLVGARKRGLDIGDRREPPPRPRLAPEEVARRLEIARREIPVDEQARLAGCSDAAWRHWRWTARKDGLLDVDARKTRPRGPKLHITRERQMAERVRRRGEAAPALVPKAVRTPAQLLDEALHVLDRRKRLTLGELAERVDASRVKLGALLDAESARGGRVQSEPGDVYVLTTLPTLATIPVQEGDGA